MSLKSMTGCGRGEALAGGIRVDVDLSSVNRKQFDVRVNLPRPLATLESRVSEVIHRKISRGSVIGTVNVTVSDKVRLKGATVDMEEARAYVRAIRKAAAKLGLKDDLSARSLLYLPDVVQVERVPSDPEKVWFLVEKALNKAVERLVVMRSAEGKALEKDIAGRLRKLEELLSRIRRLAPGIPEKYRNVLRERLDKAGIQIDSSDPQFTKELVLFADRSDISEEIVRLESHFKQASEILRSNQAAGRTLDFLCQEMFREINTIGSKANDAAVSRCVVDFKAQLECVREQIQNVE